VFTVPVDRQRLSSIAHTHHPIAAPLSGVTVNRLLRRAERRPAARILDLGCGAAAWALQALAHCPDGHADGVDRNRHALERAATAAAERGLGDRLTLHERDPSDYVPDGDYDLVVCAGPPRDTGFAATLGTAGRHVRHDGVLLAGAGFGPAGTDLAGVVAVADRAGWAPVYAHVSDAAEWDDYEWSWTGSLTEWALENPGHPDAAAALAVARERRDRWLREERGVLGFVMLVLRRT
jgi:SAM-dependent methyltransferase